MEAIKKEIEQLELEMDKEVAKRDKAKDVANKCQTKISRFRSKILDKNRILKDMDINKKRLLRIKARDIEYMGAYDYKSELMVLTATTAEYIFSDVIYMSHFLNDSLNLAIMGSVFNDFATAEVKKGNIENKEIAYFVVNRRAEGLKDVYIDYLVNSKVSSDLMHNLLNYVRYDKRREFR